MLDHPLCPIAKLSTLPSLRTWSAGRSSREPARSSGLAIFRLGAMAPAEADARGTQPAAGRVTCDAEKREKSEHRRTGRVTTAASQAAAAASRATSTAKAKLHAGAIDLNEEKNADIVIARHLWQDHRLLPPLSEARGHWAFFLKMLTLYTSFIIPLRVAFGGDTDAAGFAIVEIAMDCCFILDILVNFRTAAYTRDYELIYEAKEIAARYLKSCARRSFISPAALRARSRPHARHAPSVVWGWHECGNRLSCARKCLSWAREC